MGKFLSGFSHRPRPDLDEVKDSWIVAWTGELIRMLNLIYSATNGFFMFKFKSFEDSQKVLEDGSWFIHGHPLILKRWTNDTNFQKEKFNTIPIWVRFPN